MYIYISPRGRAEKAAEIQDNFKFAISKEKRTTDYELWGRVFEDSRSPITSIYFFNCFCDPRDPERHL